MPQKKAAPMRGTFLCLTAAPLQNFKSLLYHAANLQLRPPSPPFFSQLELVAPSPRFSEGIRFDCADHPYSKEASRYLFFSKRPRQVPWNKMTKLLWRRVKIQPVIELLGRWTWQPKMQPVFESKSSQPHVIACACLYTLFSYTLWHTVCYCQHLTPARLQRLH